MNSKKTFWQIVILIAISACVYGLQIAIFHNTTDTSFYLLQDMAFLPVTIGVTTFLVGTLLERQSRKQRIEASRILSCAFFSIIGNPLMERFSAMMDESGQMRWNSEEFDRVLELLDRNTNTILTIASNPNLLEHEMFTDLLWAVLHLREELYSRLNQNISEADQHHILGDSKRIFDLYLNNWNEYCEYTKKEYPYFFTGEAFVRWKKQVERFAERKQ